MHTHTYIYILLVSFCFDVFRYFWETHTLVLVAQMLIQSLISSTSKAQGWTCWPNMAWPRPPNQFRSGAASIDAGDSWDDPKYLEMEIDPLLDPL
jgi:hypothetical protein